VPIDAADALATSAPGVAKRFTADLCTHVPANGKVFIGCADPHVSLIGPTSVIGRAIAVFVDGVYVDAAVIGIAAHA